MLTDSELNRIVDAVSLRLADALDAFWNAAISDVHQSEARTEFAVVGAIAQGICAVANQLHADATKEKP